MKLIEGKTMDWERALYNLTDAVIKNCVFAGSADGESALKEAADIEVRDCSFSLRYPLWHTENYILTNSKMDEFTRAALWYANNGEIRDCFLYGIKCLRECKNTTISSTVIKSPEFGWKCDGVRLEGCNTQGEYIFFDSKNIVYVNGKHTGKYSFQYTENVTVSDCELDTKDAFWHAKNVTVKNCTVKGEYLAWYSENVTFINCKIIGTQPLCYCKGLKLIDCVMENTDLCFEYSQVEATVTGHIDSVKNPKSGFIKAYSIGQIIKENSVMECNCDIICQKILTV